jgi:uncharacterized protein
VSLILALTGFVVFITYGLEAMIGFGGTVFALPFATFLLGIVEARFLLAILACTLDLYIAISKFKRIIWKQFGVILLFAGLGMPLGMYAFATLPRALLIKLLGAFITLTAAFQLWKLVVAPAIARRRDPQAGVEETGAAAAPRIRWFHYALLFLGGIVHGAFAAGGPLVVLYAAKALPEKGNFRATLTLLWATLNTVLIVGFASSGMFTTARWTHLGEMAPFLVVGIVAGEIVHHRVRAEVFARIVFAILLLTGMVMMVL